MKKSVKGSDLARKIDQEYRNKKHREQNEKRRAERAKRNTPEINEDKK